MYKLFLCLRYLRKRRIAFFAVAAVCLCVAMVLIVFSVMDGFLQMVRDRSRGMLGDLVMENGALQGFPFYQEFINDLKADAGIGPLIHEATPVIINYGVVRFPRTEITKPIQIVGIRFDETCEVNNFKQGLFYENYYPGTTHFGEQRIPAFGEDASGRWVLPEKIEEAFQIWRARASERERDKMPLDDELPYERPGYYRIMPTDERVARNDPGPGWFGEELPGIILGTDLCAERRRDGNYYRYHYRGEEVQITLVPITEGGKLRTGTGAQTKILRYVDDCRTGVYDIDSMSAYMDFDVLQEILEMNEAEHRDGYTLHARATQVQIKLTPEADPESTRAMILARWETFRDEHLGKVQTPSLLLNVKIKTWEEKQARFIAAVEKEKYLVTILFGIISVVAVFMIGCIFYMIVQEKTRDIGIIKSVGATSFGVAKIFVGYGAAVGVVGGAVGTLLGALFVWYINEIQELLIRIDPSLEIWNPEVYTFDRIPNRVDGVDAVAIYVVAIMASVLGSLIAAWRAARVWPVEALRYE